MFGIPEGVGPASLMKVDRLADHPEYQKRDASLTWYAVLDCTSQSRAARERIAALRTYAPVAAAITAMVALAFVSGD
ncbi:hypothetical protein [Nocardia gipuzkoensis]